MSGPRTVIARGTTTARPMRSHSGLGDVPCEWVIGSFRHYVQFRSGQIDPEQHKFLDCVLIAPNHIESGTGRLLELESAAEQGAESGKYWCDSGDVIYSKIRPGLRKVAIAPFDCLCSADMYPLKGKPGISNKFLYWYLLSKPFSDFAELESARVAMPKLNRETLSTAVIPVPCAAEQDQIVNFLDDRTARIDALIAEKERLLASLAEWRSAELTRICFGERLAQVPTNNPWLPTLPAGWKVVRLKHLVAGIEQGWSPECESRLATQDEWGVLKAGAANAGVFREDEHKALPTALEPLPELEVKTGDVLITRASGTADYVGSFAYVYTTRHRLMLSDKNFRLKFSPEPELLPELLAWMCNTRVLREQILQFVSGADGLAKNIGSGNLKELWLAVPPIQAQPELVSELHTSLAKLDGLTQHVVEHIARLREYRSSLISAAVTGQLDAGTFQASQ